MKRILAGIATAALIGLAATGCGSSSDTETSPSAGTPTASESAAAASPATTPAAPAGVASFTEQNGKLVDKDLEAGIIDDAGFEITIDQAAKTALFQTVDPATGDAYQNSAQYDFENGTFVRTVYVSAMGATFVYTSDLASNELQTIQNGDGEDVSESVKGQGRWDNAVTTSAEQNTEIQAYFQERYGKTIEEAVTA